MQDRSRTRPSSRAAEWLFAAIILFFLAAILFPVHTGGGPSIGSTCASNVKQLAVANLIYLPDNNDRFPNRDSWMDTLVPYTKNPKMFHCPLLQKESKDENTFGYAFHGPLSGSPVPKQPATTPLIFESLNLARNASGTLKSLPNPGRHEGGGKHRNFVSYADGHVKRVTDP